MSANVLSPPTTNRRPFGGKRRLYNAVRVRFRSQRAEAFFDAGQLVVRPGDGLIVDTPRGQQLVEATSLVQRRVDPIRDIGRVVRRANDQDPGRLVALEDEARRGLKLAARMARSHRLRLKVVHLEFTFDRKSAVLYFASEKRVDFRRFVRAFSQELRCRVDMRQIGVRSGAGELGGIGVCGRELCCSSFLTEFESVSIRHAKKQRLSPNPQKLTGLCGRLRCCLAYETKTYSDIARDVPKRGISVLTPTGPGLVDDASAIQRTITVRYQGRSSETFRLEDVVVMERPWTDDELDHKMTHADIIAQRRQRRGGGSDEGILSGASTIDDTQFVWGAEVEAAPAPSTGDASDSEDDAPKKRRRSRRRKRKKPSEQGAASTAEAKGSGERQGRRGAKPKGEAKGTSSPAKGQGEPTQGQTPKQSAAQGAPQGDPAKGGGAGQTEGAKKRRRRRRPRKRKPKTPSSDG